MTAAMIHPGIIRKYRQRLPVSSKTPIVTLLEGNTPLVPANRLAHHLNLPEESLYLKLEGLNPTGSFKDRGMTLAISKALEEGSRAVICASTGNTAASAAAYAAKAGVRCIVLLPHKAVAMGKLAQSLMHGAEVIAIQGNFDQALSLVKKAAAQFRLTIVNSMNPYRIQGQKTAAFEIAETLGRSPDFQFMPVGNAGNITAYWMGYKELKEPRPRMFGFQAEGSAPIVLGKPISHPRTVATAIRIGNPVSWSQAIKAKEESGGAIESVSDREILSAYQTLAKTEGVFCEPSSAAGVAGLMRCARDGLLGQFRKKRLQAVCILTGSGLKDPDTPMRLKHSYQVAKPDLKALEKILR